jgi:hypothetical protein
MLRFTAFIAAAGFFVLAAGAAQAMPPAAPLDLNASIVSDVRMGCGPDMHPNASNRCVPNHPSRARRHLICSRGTHLAPSGRRCLPNRL